MRHCGVIPGSDDDRSDALRSAPTNAHRGGVLVEGAPASRIEDEVGEQRDRLAVLLIRHRHPPGREQANLINLPCHTNLLVVEAIHYRHAVLTPKK